MKCVHRTANRETAHLLRGALEAEGIPSKVVGEELSALRGGAIPAYVEFEVCILDDEQAPVAQVVTASWLSRRARPASGEVWSCSGCGEEHAAQFTDCWKCGRGREDA